MLFMNNNDRENNMFEIQQPKLGITYHFKLEEIIVNNIYPYIKSNMIEVDNQLQEIESMITGKFSRFSEIMRLIKNIRKNSKKIFTSDGKEFMKLLSLLDEDYSRCVTKLGMNYKNIYYQTVYKFE